MDALTATVTDAQEDILEDDELEPDSAAQARKIAGYLIVAGCVLAVACIGFIVWEQWRANKAALELQDDPTNARVYPMGNGAVRHQAPDPGSQDSPGGDAAPAGDPESVEGN